jgi:hypothetical protein
VNQDEKYAAISAPITNAATIMQGITSHHLFPWCAASRPRTADTQMDAKLIGPRQFGYGGTKALARRSVLATPSFADRVIPRPPVAPRRRSEPITCNGHSRDKQRTEYRYFDQQHEARSKPTKAFHPPNPPYARCEGGIRQRVQVPSARFNGAMRNCRISDWIRPNDTSSNCCRKK